MFSTKESDFLKIERVVFLRRSWYVRVVGEGQYCVIAKDLQCGLCVSRSLSVAAHILARHLKGLYSKPIKTGASMTPELLKCFYVNHVTGEIKHCVNEYIVGRLLLRFSTLFQ